MNNFGSVFELIDISSSGDEEGLLERASTPLFREFIQEFYRVVLEVSHSSAVTVADGEEYFDISADSLDSDCKNMRLNSSLESLEPKTYAPRKESAASRDEELPTAPESSTRECSDVFVVEEPTTHEESITSRKVAENFAQVQQEDSDSYFITPPAQ